MINKTLHVALKGFILIILLLNLGSVVYAQSEGTLLRLKATDSFNHIKLGTGFVVSGYNYIITAYHVVHNAQKIDIDRPSSMVTDDLDMLTYDTDTDIALLRLPVQLMSKLVPFESGKAKASKAKVPISVLGYGIVIDPPQKYTGYHENTPFVSSEKWNMPASMSGTSGRLFNIDDIRLLMLQAPIPYGVSGGPVINQSGKVIGVVSGALTRSAYVTSLGWAIPIDYAFLHDASQYQAKQAANVSWPALKLITDEKVYLRAFGGLVVSLIDKLNCADCIKRINTAWDTTAYAITEFQGYLMSARVSVDIVSRQTGSRKEANKIMDTQMSLLRERFAKVRDDVTAYKRQILVAAGACNRDIDAMKEAIGRLPKTDHNKKLANGVSELARDIVSNIHNKFQDSMEKTEYELQKHWSRFLSIKPLSDEGSSFLSRPSRSIESDIHVFVQYIEAYESIIQNYYSGVFKDTYRKLESMLDSYLRWVESANRQPWDRS